MRRPFGRALVAVAISFVLIGGLIAAFGTGRDRAEGAAERWLTEVGDLTRRGVGVDAATYVDVHGNAVAAAELLPRAELDGKSAFTSLEVGKAATATGGDVRVPFVVEYRAHADGGPTSVVSTLVLSRNADGWRIVRVAPRAEGELVPSEGGAAIAKAPVGLYAGGAAVGLGVTLACSWLIRRTRAAEPAVRSG